MKNFSIVIIAVGVGLILFGIIIYKYFEEKIYRKALKKYIQNEIMNINDIQNKSIKISIKNNVNKIKKNIKKNKDNIVNKYKYRESKRAKVSLPKPPPKKVKMDIVPSKQTIKHPINNGKHTCNINDKNNRNDDNNPAININ